MNQMAMNNRQKALENKELRFEKLEQKVAGMSDKEITEELKKKGIGTFGTRGEREQRLRKAYGLGKMVNNKLAQQVTGFRMAAWELKRLHRSRKLSKHCLLHLVQA